MLLAGSNHIGKYNLSYQLTCFIIKLMVRLSSLSRMSNHVNCRAIYARPYDSPLSTAKRFPVPDDKVSWDVEYKNYSPTYYIAQRAIGRPWSDPDIDDPNFKPKWNTLDGKVNRVSHTGTYNVGHGYPLNPIGRTGLCGRGVLGRWGPNHAADPVVTRWKTDRSEQTEHSSDKQSPILQVVAIKRRDTGEWALPGGMVDPGEKVSVTAIREFKEEAMNSLLASEDEKRKWEIKFKDFFNKGVPIYQGYVDDPRNTDNSWMETIAYNFHDEDGSVVGGLQLQAGDDAVGVRWVDITPDIKLYASHKEIVQKALSRLLPTNV